jgi:predicted pyridoxine 5'-phosphate oxidase superfamily flavin-nucleotide-binding protein
MAMPTTLRHDAFMDEPFHAGEIAVQERAGVRSSAAKIGRSVADEIPPAAAHFLAQRYTLYVGSMDADGRPWASELVGPPGFVVASGSRALRIAARPAPGDPLDENMRHGGMVGLLAIDFATRRRFRVNGVAVRSDDGTIEVAVTQAFGNCPKYIQRREPIAVEERPATPDVVRGASLSAPARDRIARADTFFLATVHPTAGADVSHRGGRPGFVHARADGTLVWPDYTGNRMFMSLGNVVVDARAGALFVDFETGDVVQVTGRATIDWDPSRTAAFAGAERMIDLAVDAVVESRAASPFRWRLVEPSPVNP